MLQIRHGVFETNSSSTHSITMCSKSEYEAWRNGDVYLNDGWWNNCLNDAKDKKFITKDEAISLMDEYNYCKRNKEEMLNLDEGELESLFYDFDIYSYEFFWDQRCGYLESYSDSYTTESGDKVIAFGYYGNDY